MYLLNETLKISTVDNFLKAAKKFVFIIYYFQFCVPYLFIPVGY